MSLLLLVMLAVPTDLPAVEIDTLKGEKHSGILSAIGSSSLQLQTSNAAVELPVSEILEIRFPGAVVPDPFVGPRVVLIDGTRLTCDEFTVSDGQAQLRETSQCGTITLPVALIAEVRFGISTTKLDEDWKDLSTRDSKTDLLILKKEEVLDFLGGVTGDVGEKINFLLDGDELPVAREKVYGIVFRRKQPKLLNAACQLTLSSGDLLQAYKLGFGGETYQVRLAGGAEVTLPAGSVSSIDYSAGKIRYLSQLEPRDVKFVPFWDLISYREYRRDRSLDGTPLSLAGKTYARGLAINSRTTLRYRIAGEYTRFQALMGIDDSVRGVRDYSSVRVVITGDSKPLFAGEVKGTDSPHKLELDVTGVRDFEILVDFGNETNLGDHLDLADAKFLK